MAALDASFKISSDAKKVKSQAAAKKRRPSSDKGADGGSGDSSFTEEDAKEEASTEDKKEEVTEKGDAEKSDITVGVPVAPRPALNVSIALHSVDFLEISRT